MHVSIILLIQPFDFSDGVIRSMELYMFNRLIYLINGFLNRSIYLIDELLNFHRLNFMIDEKLRSKFSIEFMPIIRAIM